MFAKSRGNQTRSRAAGPLDIEPIALTGPELARLAARLPSPPTDASPLAFLRTAPLASLVVGPSLGGHSVGVPSSQSLAVARAVAVLARPEARIRIGLQEPDGPPRQVPLYVSGGQAAYGRLEGECFLLAPPIATGSLATALFRHLESGPVDGESAELSEGAAPKGAAAIGLWPAVLELICSLWPAGSPQPLRALPPPAARRALEESASASGRHADALLDGLAAAGVVRREPAGLVLARSYRPWIETLLTGHRIEIEYTPLATSSAGVAGESDRLLFLGPAGRRVLCGYLDRSLLEAGTPFADLASLDPEWTDEADERFLFMTRLSERELALRLRDLLRLR